MACGAEAAKKKQQGTKTMTRNRMAWNATELAPSALPRASSADARGNTAPVSPNARNVGTRESE